MSNSTSLDALILGTLKGQTLNGYAIAQRVRALDERALRPGEGLVYPVLYRLASDGTVAVGRSEQPGKPPRRVYSLRADSPASTGGHEDE